MTAVQEEILRLIPPLHPYLSCLGNVWGQNSTLHDNLDEEVQAVFLPDVSVALKEGYFLTN